MPTFALAAYRQLIPPLAAILLGFLTLVVLPFFLYGPHLQPDQIILSGAFDPKDRLPYMILPVYYLSAFAAAGGPYAAAVLTVVTPVTLALSWRALDRRGQLMTLGVWGIGAATLLLLLTPLGRNILVWYFD